jgi:hypothetical protein
MIRIARVLPLLILAFACEEPQPAPAPAPSPTSQPGQLVPLREVAPELAEQLTAVPSPIRRALEHNCPELTSFAAEVVGEGVNQVAEHSGAGVPVQVAVEVGKVVVEHNQDRICEYLRKKARTQ